MTAGRLIGIGGYARAGKDSAADGLVGLGWGRTYMGKPLEAAMVTLDPLIPTPEGYLRYSTLHGRLGYDLSKQFPEVRSLIQRLGTDVGRAMFGKDVWVKMIEHEIAPLLLGGTNVVVTGIRFPNEVEMIRFWKGITVWIERPGVGPVNAHASDNSLGQSDFDFVVVNDGTIEALHRKMQAYAEEEVAAG